VSTSVQFVGVPYDWTPIYVSLHTDASVFVNGDFIDDPYELDMTDATPTGIGDPLADVLRNIDDLLEGQ
jgi:hypothetical protein